MTYLLFFIIQIAVSTRKRNIQLTKSQPGFDIQIREDRTSLRCLESQTLQR